MEDMKERQLSDSEFLKPTTWVCPHCGCPNTDYRTETAAPMCEDCLEAFDWWEVLGQEAPADDRD